MPTEAGTDDRDHGAAAAVPVPVARGTAPVPRSTEVGTDAPTGTDTGSTAAGTGTGTGSTATGTGTGHGSSVTSHRAPRFQLPLIGKTCPAELEPAGTGTAGTAGHGSSSSEGPAKRVKHSSGDSKRWTLLRSADLWLWVVIITISIVAALMSMDGTMRGWTWAGLDKDDPLRFGMPFIAELSFLMWLLIAEVAIRAQRSPYPWWAIALVNAAGIVLLNTAFGGDRPHPYREAAIFGVASAVSLAGAFAKFYLRYVASEVHKGLRSGAKPKLLLSVQVIEQPKLRWRAHLIVSRVGSKVVVGEDGTAKREPLTVDEAIGLADLWQQVYQDYMAPKPDGTKGDKELAKRTAWTAVKKECGVKVYKTERLQVGRVEFVEPERTRTERIQTPEEALQKFERELVDKPAAPKSPRIGQTYSERPAGAPVSPAPVDAVEMDEPPQEWFDIHATRITKVQALLEGWPNIQAPPSVDDMQKDIGRRLAGSGLGNRTKATQVAKCIKWLWLQAQADNAPTGN